MLRALRVMTVERGIDPREYALMPFGGAGPLHACALAERAGDRARRVPARLRCALRARPGGRRAAARRLAYGDAARGRHSTRTPWRAAREELLAQAGSVDGAETSMAGTVYELRYRGQSYELPVESRLRRPRGPARAVRAGARAALWLSRRRGRGRAGDDPRVGLGRGASLEPARRRRRGTASGDRGAGGASPARGDAVRPARVGGRGRRVGHDPAAARARRERRWTRSSSRSSPALCARRARRWARC